jgi:hypothetical protein
MMAIKEASGLVEAFDPGKDLILQMEGDEEKIKDFHLKLNAPGEQVLTALLGLYFSLLRDLRLREGDYIQEKQSSKEGYRLCFAAACGCFRTLRVCRRLLLYGLFIEMHATMRMLIEWLKCVLALKIDSKAAAQALRKGIDWKDIKPISDEDRQLKKDLQEEWGELSARCHITKTAFRLLPPDLGLIGGDMNPEVFRKESLEVANMARNALELLLDHYDKMPPEWHQLYETTRQLLTSELARSRST